MTLTIAIAGRPNVGKSTLFNRLVGKRMAIVSDESGVTRDWREEEAELMGFKFRLLDTAGLEDVRAKGSLNARMVAQTKRALEKTQLILLVVDARVGLTAEDKAVAREIRKMDRPIILLANKCEGTRLPPAFDEFAALGFGEPIPVSASHGDGLADIYDAFIKIFGEPVEEEEPVKPKRAFKEVKEGDLDFTFEDEVEEEEQKRLNIAIVGRPNAGKSTMVNQLLGEERMLTGPEPGLTRDSIPTAWEYKGTAIRLVDTAGMRRRSRVDEKLERMSVQESLRTIRLAHVVVLVIDGTQTFDKQDLIIAQHVMEEGRVLLLAVNKWDAVKNKREAMEKIEERAHDSLAQAPGMPIICLSALNGDGLDSLMKAVMKQYEIWNTRVSTGKLNRWLENMEANHPPPITSGRRIKLRYMTQLKSRPPTFGLWINKPVDLPESYLRFLTNGLREAFKLQGVPIRWSLRKSENPYADDKK